MPHSVALNLHYTWRSHKQLKAVILAGGRGKRMRPVTDYVPKPLVPVCNVPILEWQIRHLVRFGIRDVIVCTGYKAGMIRDRIGAKSYGARVEVSAEEAPLGTGGAIRRAAGHIGRDDSFVVMNGDVITDIDIGALTKVRNSVAAIPLRTNYGVMRLGDGGDAGDGDGDGGGGNTGGAGPGHDPYTIARFDEKRDMLGLWMNAGLYHLGREVLAELPEVGDIEKTLFPKYAESGRLRAVVFGESATVGDMPVMWQSVDSIKDLEACESMLRERGLGTGAAGPG